MTYCVRMTSAELCCASGEDSGFLRIPQCAASSLRVKLSAGLSVWLLYAKYKKIYLTLYKLNDLSLRCEHVSIHVCVHVYARVYVPVSVPVHMYVCACVCVPESVPVCMYV